LVLKLTEILKWDYDVTTVCKSHLKTYLVEKFKRMKIRIVELPNLPLSVFS
jgi:hypothetical protein